MNFIICFLFKIHYDLSMKRKCTHSTPTSLNPPLTFTWGLSPQSRSISILWISQSLPYKTPTVCPSLVWMKKVSESFIIIQKDKYFKRPCYFLSEYMRLGWRAKSRVLNGSQPFFLLIKMWGSQTLYPSGSANVVICGLNSDYNVNNTSFPSQ